MEEIRARRDAGAATTIDVSQAEAQLETAEALVTSAESELEISVAEYVAAVGRSPGDLAALPALPGIPKTIEEVMAISSRESPAIRQAQFAEASSRAQVREARSAFRPTVSINGTLGYTGQVEPFFRQNYQRAASLSLTFTQPIFAGGLNASRARQASAQDSAALIQINTSERSVIQTVTQAWSERRAAIANSHIEEAAVHSARETYDGMRVEYRAGLRATLDLLIAQETARDAQISLATARHDAYVADTTLLQAIGRLDANKIIRGLPLYDPEVDFKHIRGIGEIPTQIIPQLLDQIGAPVGQRPPSSATAIQSQTQLIEIKQPSEADLGVDR